MFLKKDSINRNSIPKTTFMKFAAKAIECVGDDFWKVAPALEAAGFNWIGGGHYGAAYAYKDCPGWVVKVSGKDSNDSFAAYVYWCIQNPGDHIPEYKYPTFSADRSVFMVIMPRYEVCMDRVNEYNGGDLQDQFKDICCALRRYGGADSLAGIRSSEGLAALKIRDYFKDKASFDMHDENVMWDPLRQQLMITDPIHGGNVDTMVAELTKVPNWKPMEQIEMSFEPAKLSKKLGSQMMHVSIPAGNHAAIMVMDEMIDSGVARAKGGLWDPRARAWMMPQVIPKSQMQIKAQPFSMPELRLDPPPAGPLRKLWDAIGRINPINLEQLDFAPIERRVAGRWQTPKIGGKALTPQQKAQLERELDKATLLDRLHAPNDHINICLMPPAQFLKINDPIPDTPVPIITLPVDQARAIRDAFRKRNAIGLAPPVQNFGVPVLPRGV